MEGCEFLSACAAADAMAAGDLTSERLIETLLARIERLEPRLGAFVDVYADDSLAGVDALLTPTVRTAAPAVADIDQSTTAAILTRLVNVSDCCALAVPNGMTAGGLPLSLQIICRGHEEATALRIGQAYQEATDWHVRVPPGLDAAAD